MIERRLISLEAASRVAEAAPPGIYGSRVLDMLMRDPLPRIC